MVSMRKRVIVARVTLNKPEKLKERRHRGAKAGFHERDKRYTGLV